MRIISGSLKGKSINFLKNSTTRPLKDAVRENIFNVLKHSNLINGIVENANILDLYSGIGSFGLECISRGAKKVTFVEYDKDAANILNENLIKLNVINKALIINNKVDKILEKKKS
jgi:16S rRNA (guanine966-N2)-methyltransferase